MNILVSGADGNLGSAVVKYLTENNKNIFGLYGSEDSLAKRDFKSPALSANLMDEAEARNAITKAYQAYPTIDAAVLTVGGFSMGKISDVSAADIHHQIKLNFDTAFNLIKPLMEKMQGGSQIFLIGAKQLFAADALQNVVSYGLAKQMVFSLFEIINAGYADHGINAHIIIPSIIDTPQNREGMPEADFNDWVKPEAIAATINFYLDHPELKKTVIKTFGRVV